MGKYQIDVGSWDALNRLLDQALEQPPPDGRHAGWKRCRRSSTRSSRSCKRTVVALRAGRDRRLPEHAAEVRPAARRRRAPPRTEQPGDVIGPYRLERELGSGGMGVVWLAVRTDGLIKRPVALKLPHGAWKRAGLAERMAREREILASLDASEHRASVRRGRHRRRPALPRHRIRRRHARRCVLPRAPARGPRAAANCSRRPRRRWPMRTASWWCTGI